MSESPPVDLSVDHDVIIVGAGLAGLSAARELKNRDPELRLLVLEAKDRVGGRTLTVPMKTANNSTDFFDLGGQWVGLTQTHILQLMKELQLETHTQWDQGIRWAQLGQATPRKYNTTLPISSIRQFSLREIVDLTLTMLKMERMARKINVRDVFQQKELSSLNEMSLSSWYAQNCWTRGCRDALDILSRSIYGAEAGRVNMLYHLTYCKSAGSLKDLIEDCGDGAQAFRVKGGTQQFSIKMAEEIGKDKIVFNQAVEEVNVDEHNDITTIHLKSTDGGRIQKTLTCKRLILAIPPSECFKIKFTPDLPNLKKKLFESMPPGHYIKCVITYETAFWRTEGYSGAILSTGRTVIHGEVLPILLVYDDTSENGHPALVVFINDEYADRTREDRCNLVTRDLVRFFGDAAMNQFIDYQEKVWSKEPYNGGCPVGIIGPGSMDAYQSIRDPFYTVHFAGTETATEWIGYMSGAVQSGLRAAHEVLQELEKYNLVAYKHLEGTMYDSNYTVPLPPSTAYNETTSPWWRRLFFAAFLGLGIMAYSKKYQLSVVAKTVQPLEHKLVKFFTGLTWPT